MVLGRNTLQQVVEVHLFGVDRHDPVRRDGSEYDDGEYDDTEGCLRDSQRLLEYLDDGATHRSESAGRAMHR